MSQVWDESGKVIPVTILVAEPMTVVQVKDGGKDGYKAVQVGIGTQKAERVGKAVVGHTKGLGAFKFLKEFRLDDEKEILYKRGDKIDLSVFVVGDVIQVSSISKAKGFQGGVKRHGFAGGSRTHGQKHSEREPGSIGGGARAGGRVAKGMRMAGRMGGDRITVKNLEVVQVDLETSMLAVKGAVPGKRGTLVEVIAK